MQGRPGQDQGSNRQSSLDRSATSSFRLSELSGRQPVVPKRPPGMTRLDQPPSTQRVARPRREDPPRIPRPRTWKWWAGCAGGLVLLGVIAAVVVYGVTNLFIAVNVASGSATTAGAFLSDLQSANYNQAYNALDSTLTVSLTRTTFEQQAKADDKCFGKVTDSNEVDNSATNTTIDGVQTFTYIYNITRSKLKSTYQMHLTLQKDTSGNWYITDYGKDLGPSTPGCS